MRCPAVLPLMSALVLLGCAAPRGPAAPSLLAPVAPPGLPADVRFVAGDARFERARAARFWSRLQAAAAGRPVRILALSGGGAGGAFAAGALVGLSRGGHRPAFTLVTGVSTGALLAPFAFLGESWDAQLEKIFLGNGAEHVLRHPGTGLLLHASVYSNRALSSLVDQLFTDRLIDAVAVQAARGRALLVATTNLDTQDTVIWDLGAIALQPGERARELFRRVILASASYPGLLPPVLIHVEGSGRVYDEMHVDGGTTVPFFVLPPIIDGSSEALATLRGARVYVLVNRQLDAEARTTRDGTFAVLRRSYSSVLRYLSRMTLQLDADLAQRYGMTLLASSVPVDYPLQQPFNFEPAAMHTLFEYAADCAATGRLWTTADQALERGVRAPVAAGQQPECPRAPPAPQLADAP